MKKILILGATGMAGHIVHDYLSSKHKYAIENVSFRSKLNDNTVVIDVRDQCKLSDYILQLKPDIIINCIGVLIKGSSNCPKNAIYLNSYLPHVLSGLTKRLGSQLIHISTDCVFSGDNGEYTEKSLTDARDIYGRSKILGEINNSQDLTIRTSIIGPELKSNGEGLLHWFFKQNKVKGYTKAYWSGVTTLELAKAIEYYIDTKTTGLLNLTNGFKVSKYDLLNLVSKIFEFPIIIEESSEKTIDKSLKTIYSDCYKVNSYEIMLEDLHEWMMMHKSMYINEYPNLYVES